MLHECVHKDPKEIRGLREKGDEKTLLLFTVQVLGGHSVDGQCGPDTRKTMKDFRWADETERQAALTVCPGKPSAPPPHVLRKMQAEVCERVRGDAGSRQ